MKRKKYAKHKEVPRVETRAHSPRILKSLEKNKKKKLEIVLKCDSAGSEEAVLGSLSAIEAPEIELKVIHSDVGAITKSDLLLALTASKLVLGFNVGIAPKIEPLCREQGIEVHLYDVIYNLTKDETEMLIHFGKNRTQQWQLVRLEEPEGGQADAGPGTGGQSQ